MVSFDLPFNQNLFFSNPCMHAKSFRSCLTLCDPMDCSPPGSPVPGILQAGTLEGAGISSSGGSSRTQGSSVVSPALAGGFLTTGATWDTLSNP